MYLFDPIQFKEFGKRFYQKGGFYYRYQEGRKWLIGKNVYIPNGPVCQAQSDFIEFLKHTDQFFKKSTKPITTMEIDLPLILNKKIRSNVHELLTQHGFSSTTLYSEDETLIIYPDKFALKKLKKKGRYYVQRGLKENNVIVSKNPSTKQLNNAYSIYKMSADRIGYKVKPIRGFQKLANQGILAVSYGGNKELHGFALGYISKFPGSDVLQIVFSGITQKGLKSFAGYATYFELIKYVFEKTGIDIIDLYGASRKRNPSYLHFKKTFSNNFVPWGGGFVKKSIDLRKSF